jgi:UDP-2,3-diacylglucosamine pyrophosphatase LpxH
MKACIRLISDLHYDKYPDIQDLFEKLDFYFPKVLDNEILIVAGDIGFAVESGEDGEVKIREGYIKVLKYFRSRWKHIIIVPGNHEYYTSKTSIEKVNNLISNQCESMGIEYLNKDAVELFGYTFIGCTLWSPMKKHVFDGVKKENWNFIQYDELLELHYNHKQWLENILEKYKTKSDSNGAYLRDKIIVITHYLPSEKLLSRKYRTENYNKGKSAYVADLDSVIYRYNFLIPFWFCGHSHTSEYRRFNNTIVTNCGVIGNPWEQGDSPIFQDVFELI